MVYECDHCGAALPPGACNQMPNQLLRNQLSGVLVVVMASLFLSPVWAQVPPLDPVHQRAVDAWAARARKQDQGASLSVRRRFPLPQRRKLAYGLDRGYRLAEAQAMRAYPEGSSASWFQQQSRVRTRLEDKFDTDFRRKHRLTYDEQEAIAREAMAKKWPLSPVPYESPRGIVWRKE